MKKNISDRLVLSCLAARGRVTVPDLARHLGLPASTAAGVIERLSGRGLIAPGPLLVRGRGRPVATYGPRLSAPAAACQFDGTRLAAGIFDRDLNLVAETARDFERVETPAQAAETVSGALREMAARGAPQVSGLALSINAVTTGGRTLASSVLPWARTGVAREFSRRLALETRVVSGTALLAEYRKLPEPLPRVMMRLAAGDGVSAHTVFSGLLRAGRPALEGELGHVAREAGGPLCGCGRRGCLEAWCAGPAVVHRALDDLASGVAGMVDRAALAAASPRQALEMIGRAWEAGDGYARGLMDDVLDRLAWGLGAAVNLVAPDLVVMGGYVLGACAQWPEEVRRRAERWIFRAARRRTVYRLSRVTRVDELRVAASIFCGTGFDGGQAPA